MTIVATSTATLTLIGAVIAAVAVLASTLINARVTKKASSETNKHMSDLANENRQQMRIEGVYTSIQQFVGGWETYAKWCAQPLRANGTEPTLPTSVSEERIAQIGLMATTQVTEAMDVFFDKVHNFRVALGGLEDLRKFSDPDIAMRLQIVEASNAKVAAAREIEVAAKVVLALMRAELRVE